MRLVWPAPLSCRVAPRLPGVTRHDELIMGYRGAGMMRAGMAGRRRSAPGRTRGEAGSSPLWPGGEADPLSAFDAAISLGQGRVRQFSEVRPRKAAAH